MMSIQEIELLMMAEVIYISLIRVSLRKVHVYEFRHFPQLIDFNKDSLKILNYLFPENIPAILDS